MKGYDFDGVITKGIIPSIEDCIITGRTWKDLQRTKEEMKKLGVPDVPIYLMPPMWKLLRDKNGLKETGRWKALMIDATGVDEFFEDNLVQYQSILDNLKGYAKITKV